MHWDIFAYGTLRQGLRNHHYVRGATPLGPATTTASYAMYVADAVPYLVTDEPRYRVAGEVYRVNARTLAALDELEEHPLVYCRSRAQVVFEHGATALVWIYFARQARGRLASHGDFARMAGFSTI